MEKRIFAGKHPFGKKTKIIFLVLAAIVVSGFLLPEKMVIPVKGATRKDWHPKTFWYEPWGKSGVHKGMDIFAVKGKPVVAATCGIVIFQGKWDRGGKVVLILGPKWRVHYYAHLDAILVQMGSPVSAGKEIGRVGNTGNAKTTPSHLHYSIVTLFPYFQRLDNSTQGWKKIFYLDPVKKLVSYQPQAMRK